MNPFAAFLFAFVITFTTAQEFKFTASCGSSELVTTNTNNYNDLNDKIDDLITSLLNDEQNQSSVSTTRRSISDHLLMAKLDSLIDMPPPSYIPGSCKDIKDHWSRSPSGYYTIATANGETTSVYCHMEELCNTKGPWTRIAYLNMSDPTHRCPPGFRLYSSNGVRACGRLSSSAGCTANIYFSPPSKGYSQVCGRMIGYQQYSPDAVYQTGKTLDQDYVDGISLTLGSPRQHVWTFAAGRHHNTASSYNCPCTTGQPQSLPSFVGEHYFCESGNSESSVSNKLYTSDPLWDGDGCGAVEEDCCSVPGLPWFHKVLTSSTTDFLEMRICADEVLSNEDIPVELYEIYVN